MEESFDYNQVPTYFVHCFNARCPRAGELFQPVRLVQEAWGLRNALDRLPHKEAVAIKKRLNRLYTRPTLSRIMNHQRSIPPAEQAALLKLFAAAGVPADQVFDRVQPSYDWAARP